jgi:hypothetical protein
MYKNYINLENFNHKLSYNFPRGWQDGITHKFPIPKEWTGGGFIMVAAFPVITWPLQRVSQMANKDMLHATYRLKIAICCRNKGHLPQRDRRPYEVGMLMKRPY